MFKRGWILTLMLMVLVMAQQVALAQDSTNIVSFTTNTAGYVPGEPLTVNWEVAGVDLAILEVYDLAAPDFPMQLYELPTEGSRDVFVATDATNGIRLVLWAANRPTSYTPVTMYEYVGSQSTELVPEPPCRPSFYFSDVEYTACPVMIQNWVEAAFQAFENGFLLWRSDTGDVWAMLLDTTTIQYPVSEYGSLPDNPITVEPPTGYSSPISGFGKVWGNYPELREVLGWALGPEVGYTMTTQTEATPGRVSYFYMSLPEGQVTRVENGFWTFETAE